MVDRKVEKGRDWTFIVYLSAPEQWRELLDETHLKWVESPLHDNDINADGTKKKAHYHVMISFDGPVTKIPVEKLTEALTSPIPMKVASGRGLVRYMIHLDNPEKYQYERSNIIGHGGADVDSYFEATYSNRLESMKLIVRYIYENDIDNYADFLMYCIEFEDSWFDVAINKNTLAINKMIDAVWQKKKNLK